jgi:hypothetical protein
MAGALSADGGGPDRDFAQLRASLGFRATAWLIVEAAFATRTYSAAIARQRWKGASLGASTRLPFAGGHLAGIGRLALQPFTTVSDLAAPNAAVSAAAGVEYRGSRAALGLSYWLERYDFPPAGGVARREQFAGLTVRATWSLARALTAR